MKKMVPIVFDNEDLEFISKVLKDYRAHLIVERATFFSTEFDSTIKYCESLANFIKEYLHIYKDRED